MKHGLPVDKRRQRAKKMHDEVQSSRLSVYDCACRDGQDHCNCQTRNSGGIICNPIHPLHKFHIRERAIDKCEMKHSPIQLGDEIPMALLQTCRQIYNEARFIPFTDTTFTFDMPFQLAMFFLIHSSSSHIRSVAILTSDKDRFAEWRHECTGWDKVLCKDFLQNFPNLRFLDITLLYDESYWVDPKGLYVRWNQIQTFNLDHLKDLDLDNVGVQIAMASTRLTWESKLRPVVEIDEFEKTVRRILTQANRTVSVLTMDR